MQALILGIGPELGTTSTAAQARANRQTLTGDGQWCGYLSRGMCRSLDSKHQATACRPEPRRGLVATTGRHWHRRAPCSIAQQRARRAPSRLGLRSPCCQQLGQARPISLLPPPLRVGVGTGTVQRIKAELRQQMFAAG
jgi:hypothetical protein